MVGGRGRVRWWGGRGRVRWWGGEREGEVVRGEGG